MKRVNVLLLLLLISSPCAFAETAVDKLFHQNITVFYDDATTSTDATTFTATTGSVTIVRQPDVPRSIRVGTPETFLALSI